MPRTHWGTRAVTAATGLLALADDSGMEVDAFGRAARGRSSRGYGGEGLTDPERNALMPAGARWCRRAATARYRAAIRGDRA